MRLINTVTLELEEYHGSNIPPYAILSHTWGSSEATYPHWILPGHGRGLEGFDKVSKFCKIARARNYGHAWADTCCIDKNSSADLSEAINSMYQYYQNSGLCLVHLMDVSAKRGSAGYLVSDGTQVTAYDLLAPSRWFTRGWTLQELLAPRKLEFYDKDWSFLGDLGDLYDSVSWITRIPANILLKKKQIAQCSVAERMARASRRETLRIEDRAYSLLGIFGISLPLLYGEGTRSFIRLQEEIIRQSTDHSIFAWALQRRADHRHSFGDLLASSPHDFLPQEGLTDHVVQCYQNMQDWVKHYEITNVGFRMWLPLLLCQESKVESHYHAVLNCRSSSTASGPLALNIVCAKPADSDDRGSFAPQEFAVTSMTCKHRRSHSRLVAVDEEDILWLKQYQITLTRERTANPYVERVLNRWQALDKPSKPVSKLTVAFDKIDRRIYQSHSESIKFCERFPASEWDENRPTWTPKSRIGAISIEVGSIKCAIIIRNVWDIAVVKRQRLLYTIVEPGDCSLQDICASKDLRIVEEGLDLNKASHYGFKDSGAAKEGVRLTVLFRSRALDSHYFAIILSFQKVRPRYVKSTRRFNEPKLTDVSSEVIVHRQRWGSDLLVQDVSTSEEIKSREELA